MFFQHKQHNGNGLSRQKQGTNKYESSRAGMQNAVNRDMDEESQTMPTETVTQRFNFATPNSQRAAVLRKHTRSPLIRSFAEAHFG